MAVATGTAMLVAGGLAAGGGIASSIIGSNAADDAGSDMAKAAYLANLAQQNNYGDQMAMMAPWIQAGTMGANTLADLMGTASGLSKTQRAMTQDEYISTITDPQQRHNFRVQLALGGKSFEELVPESQRMKTEWTGTPTNPLSQENYQKSPYYDFLMQQGTQGLERGAAARGGQFSGREAQALTSFGQNLASQDFSKWQENWLRSLSPWQSLAGMGQSQVNQAGNMGTQAAGQYGNYLMQGASSQAASTMGQANTWIPMINWAGQQGGNLLTQFAGQQGQQGQSVPGTGYWPGVGNYMG